MKTTAVPEREMAAVSFRSAWDMRRAWSPGRRSADTERQVDGERARRDDQRLLERARRPQLHDGALAELALDLGERELQGLPPVLVGLRFALRVDLGFGLRFDLRVRHAVSPLTLRPRAHETSSRVGVIL